MVEFCDQVYSCVLPQNHTVQGSHSPALRGGFATSAAPRTFSTC